MRIKLFILLGLCIGLGGNAAWGDTDTPTATETATFTATPTVTETATITPTLTVSRTNTVSPTISPTPSITLTATHSATVTLTPTVTPTFTITLTVAPPVQVVSLDHNRFNPLKGEVVHVTNLRADHGSVTVMVYNPSGVLVRRVVDHEEAPAAAAVWDGRNDQNEVVASGVYLVVVTGNKLHKRFRIAVLK